MKKGIEHELLIWKILNEIRESSRFKNSKQFIQHGKTMCIYAQCQCGIYELLYCGKV